MTGAALTPGVAAMLLFGSFFLLWSLRVPVAFALGLACLPVLFVEPRLSPMVVFNTTFKAYNSFILLAVPFFLLTANLMNVGGITDRRPLSRTCKLTMPNPRSPIPTSASIPGSGTWVPPRRFAVPSKHQAPEAAVPFPHPAINSPVSKGFKTLLLKDEVSAMSVGLPTASKTPFELRKLITVASPGPDTSNNPKLAPLKVGPVRARQR